MTFIKRINFKKVCTTIISLIFFLQNLIFYHPFESINFRPAGLLKIALIVTPLINPLKNDYFLVHLILLKTAPDLIQN